jgi:hypothetical protein
MRETTNDAEKRYKEGRRLAYDHAVGNDGVRQLIGSQKQYRIQKCGKGRYLVRVWGDEGYIGLKDLDEASEKSLRDNAEQVMPRKAMDW